MGFLSRLALAQQSPWAALDPAYRYFTDGGAAAPQAQQPEPTWNLQAMPGYQAQTPPPSPAQQRRAPSVPALQFTPQNAELMAATGGPQMNAAPQQTTAQLRAPTFSERLEGLYNNPMLNIGLSLLGNARNGGDWGAVGRDMQTWQQQRQQQRRQDNEDRRLAAQDRRAETQFSWAGAERDRQTQQRQSLDEWVATLPAEQQAAARANPQAAHAAYMEAQAAAGMPITPFQQAQLDLQRRGQQLDYSAAMARMNVDRPLRGPDAALMNDVRDSAARGQALVALGDQFMAANEAEPGTGAWTGWYPSNNWDPERASMRASSAQMRGYMRPPGSGATSDFEQRLYGLGAPNTLNSLDQNRAIVAGHRAAAELSNARRFFYEDYVHQNGTLNGAERAFQQSPDFQRIQRGFEQEFGEGARGGRGGQAQQPRPQRGPPGPRPPNVPRNAYWDAQAQQWVVD